GLGSEVQNGLIAVTKNYQAYPSGMANLGGNSNPSSTEPYIEQEGEVAAALNEALVQDYDGLVRIAPAWPTAWNASGQVYIQGNSKVDVQVASGKVVLAIIEAGSSGSVSVRNPWGSETVSVVDGSTSQPVTTTMGTSANAFTFSTITGHWYVIAPSSTAASLQPIVVTGTPATKAKTLGSETIGL
ncbi:MAG TPA: hypothetical protein VK745_26060, partial [Polyangiaceae bacterium]|nr:hypothetical protein [Polyangiaceae bacterium]